MQWWFWGATLSWQNGSTIPQWPKFSPCHAVFRSIWLNHGLMPPREGGCVGPPPQRILDPSLKTNPQSVSLFISSPWVTCPQFVMVCYTSNKFMSNLVSILVQSKNVDIYGRASLLISKFFGAIQPCLLFQAPKPLQFLTFFAQPAVYPTFILLSLPPATESWGNSMFSIVCLSFCLSMGGPPCDQYPGY